MLDLQTGEEDNLYFWIYIMAEIRTKPISELEKKTWVSNEDSILIVDKVTGEARLADKEELKD